jgi:hypothetical protein
VKALHIQGQPAAVGVANSSAASSHADRGTKMAVASTRIGKTADGHSSAGPIDGALRRCSRSGASSLASGLLSKHQAAGSMDWALCVPRTQT